MAGNKYSKKAIVVLYAAVFVLILTGCAKETPTEDNEDETAAGPNEALVVELGIGIGPVKFGMSKEEVIENFGEPDEVEGRGQGLNYFASRGISLFVPPSRGVLAIDCWSDKYPSPFTKISNFAGKTKEGIGMNASRAEIVAAYGEPDRTTSNGPMTTLHYEKLRVQFVIMHDKLINLKINAPR